MEKRLIIVEGVDGAGKTTLIKGLEQHCIFDYEFNYSYPKQVTPDLCMAYAMGEYKASARIFKRLLAMGSTVVCDRFHLAEYAYGPVMRSYSQKDAYNFIKDFEAYLLDIVPHDRIASIVLLADPETTVARKDLKSEYPGSLGALERINNRYMSVPSVLDSRFIVTDNMKLDEILEVVLKWIH